MNLKAVRLISAAAIGGFSLVAPVIAMSSEETAVAICPRGMVDNPAGYGCVPYMPGIGAPTQEVLTRCNGNYYICVWPYPVP